MRVIIAGGRDIKDPWLAVKGISEFLKLPEVVKTRGAITTVVSGGCKTGIDPIGERWATEHSIEVAVFLADWDRFGRSAGPRRN